jgi:hypothetical protein
MRTCKEDHCETEVEVPGEKYCGFHSLVCDLCQAHVDDVYTINGISYCHGCYDGVTSDDYANQQMNDRSAKE